MRDELSSGAANFIVKLIFLKLSSVEEALARVAMRVRQGGHDVLLRDHLNPGGYAVSWIPTERSARTFLKVFPYVWEHRPFMIGSNMPITFDRERMTERLSDRKVVDHFTMAGVNIRDLLAPYVTGEGREFDPSYDRSGLLDVNTDLFPRDEFDVPPLLTWAMFRSHGSH